MPQYESYLRNLIKYSGRQDTAVITNVFHTKSVVLMNSGSRRRIIYVTELYIKCKELTK